MGGPSFLGTTIAPERILTSMMKESSDMRKSLWLAAALLGALAVAGCQSEMMEPERPSGTKTLKVIAGSDDTRTGVFLDENSNKYKSCWSATDQLFLLEMIYANAPLENTMAHLEDFMQDYRSRNPELQDGGTKAIFDFQLNEDNQALLPPNEVFRYIGFCPMNTIRAIYWAGADPMTAEMWEQIWGVDFTSNHVVLAGGIPDKQSPSSESFDPESDLLFSRVVESAVQPEEMKLAFARIGCIAKITLKGLPPNYYVTKGTFSHGASWPGTGDILYDTQLERALPFAEISDYPIEPTPIEFEPNNLRVNEKGEAVIWLRTLSGKLTDWFKVDVSVSPDGVTPSYQKYTKSFDLQSHNKSITFREGNITSFSVALEEKTLIEFDEETTLKYFPELAGVGQPVIRILKDYDPDDDYNGWNHGFPFFFDSELSWELSINYPYDCPDEEKWIEVEQRDNGYYLVPHTYSPLPETATLVLTCTDNSDVAPIEIPIEGFCSIAFKHEGYYLEGSSDVYLTSGQSSTLMADIQLPSWLELVPDSFRWEVMDWEDDVSEIVTYEEQGSSLAMTAREVNESISFIVYFSMDCLNHLSGTEEVYGTNGYYIHVEPRSIPLKWKGVDWNGKTLMLTYGETAKIQADLNGISTENISRIDWSPNTNYGYLEIEESPDSYSVTIQAGSWEDSGSIELTVETLDGTVYHSVCYVDVSPVMLKKKTGNTSTRLYGDPIVLSPGGSCELEASIYPNSGYGSADYKPKWSVASNRYIDVHYYDVNRYQATVYANTPGDANVIFELWHQWGEYQHQTDLSLSFEYPVHVLPENQ